MGRRAMAGQFTTKKTGTQRIRTRGRQRLSGDVARGTRASARGSPRGGRASSGSESPPNFSSTRVRERLSATTASPTTPAAGHHAGVAALEGRLLGLLRAQVDRGERHHQRRDRLHDRLRPQLLAVRDRRPRARRRGCVRPVEAARVVVADLVVEARAGRLAGREPVADRDRLHGRDRHERLGEPSVEPAVPLRERPQARRHAARDRPRTRRPRCRPPSWPCRCSRSSAAATSARAQRTGLSSIASRSLPARRRRPRASAASPMRTTWLRSSTPTARRSASRQPARRDARRRLARARALEHVAQVLGAELQGAREIGVAGPRPLQRAARARLVGLRVGRHHVAPSSRGPCSGRAA